MPQKDITTEADLEDTTRGKGSHVSDAPSTCFLIHDGTYIQNGTTLSMLINVGGSDSTHRRIFVGQSRTGVIVKGRATVARNVSHVQLSNLTFDLNGYSQAPTDTYNTLSMLRGSVDLRIDHVTFTGDCLAGARGGHVEVDGSSDVTVEACIIEKFGRCGTAAGHEDHGVYLAAGDTIVIRNNDIRGNSSRGVQLNTNGAGKLSRVIIENNRIHDNGHATYEDGIVMNATGTGNISDVTVQHNLIYSNFYSGLRQSGAVLDSIVVTKNTFFHNGSGTTAGGRSEANLDDVGSGAHTVFSKNVFVASHAVLNDSYDAQPRSYALADNVVQGTLVSGTAGGCVTASVSVDPLFSDAAGFDFHVQNASVNGYGAYAP